MAETLLQYHQPVVAPNGAVYRARACGCHVASGAWHGWIEFTPAAGDAPIRTGRETMQPNRKAVTHWATTVSPVYLEGALLRALSRITVNMRLPTPSAIFSTPSAGASAEPRGGTALDPFAIYQLGEPTLRRRLASLAESDLVNIAVTYELTSLRRSALDRLPAASLVEVIVLGVRDRTIFAPGP